VAWLALGLEGLYVSVTGLNTVLARRRTGTWVLRMGGRRTDWTWPLFLSATALGSTAPVLDLAGALHRISPLDGVAGHVAGVVIGLGGAALVFLAQVQMGASWRIGLDPEERTDLVTAGLFGLVRNPIYTGMLATIVGIALLVPNVVALIAVADLVTAVELQVRRVEEPYLALVHGDAYRAYLGRVGRFVPGLG